MALDGDKAGSRENGEMGRHGVVRHFEPPCDLAGWKTIWFLLHEEPKCFEPGGLRQGGEGLKGEILFHMSGIIDGFCDSQVTGRVRSARVRDACSRAASSYRSSTPSVLVSTFCQLSVEGFRTYADLLGYGYPSALLGKRTVPINPGIDASGDSLEGQDLCM